MTKEGQDLKKYKNKTLTVLFHSIPGAEERSQNEAQDKHCLQKVQKEVQQLYIFNSKVYLDLPGPKMKRSEKHQTGGSGDAGSARPLFSFILRKGEHKQHKRKLRNEDRGIYVTSLFRGFWKIN